jgi:hypothetical protein
VDNANLWGTSCKDCWFADYIKNTQIGCSIGIINKLWARCEVIECYDEEKEFYLLKNKICPYYRDKNIIKEEPTFEKIRQSNTIKYEVVIYLNKISRELSDLELLNDITFSINNQTLSPRKVIFIIHNADMKPSDLRGLIGVPYRIETITDEMTKEECVDMMVKKMEPTTSYYIVLEAKDKINDNQLFSKLDKVVNDEFQRIIIAQHQNLHIVNKLFHNLAGGNKGETTIKKFEEICQTDNSCPLVIL